MTLIIYFMRAKNRLNFFLNLKNIFKKKMK